ncbi:MAG TPA: GNAT family N-acetyltransferase [Cytophagales bacterium]|nr:GNAT family N-acetyltransferase [Cytophagales bacterium]
MKNISYRSDVKISPDQFIDVLKRSTLDERRPVNSIERITKMLEYGNVLVTAWHNKKLVGVSRALTDFSFCCYLSDLAVDQDYQKKGIGKRLIDETHKVSGELTTLILLAAPAAVNYYPKIGMEQFKDCFIFRRK